MFAVVYFLDKTIVNDETKLRNDKFLLGKDNAGRSGGVYGAAVYDEMEFWAGPRDYLIASGYIQRGDGISLLLFCIVFCFVFCMFASRNPLSLILLTMINERYKVFTAIKIRVLVI